MGRVIDVEEFRKDLRTMSLEDTLIKHNVSLEEAMDCMPKTYTKPKPKKKRLKNVDRYIQERDGRFYLRKWINGKTLMFGTYNSLNDAKKVREHCEKHGWKQNCIKQYCEELGIELISVHKTKERYE